MSERPSPNSYWIIPGHFLAGEYPATRDEHSTREKLSRYLDTGINYFIDLTEPGELMPYEPVLQELAAARNITVQHRRLSIRDLCVPRHCSEMVTILDAIDGGLAEGRNIYVHCWGGTGRTGTVVGCYLVRQGISAEAALAQMSVWWRTVGKVYRSPRTPETEEQRRYIMQWNDLSQF